jgi:agmatine deiminase
MPTPAECGYRFPAEWAPHRRCWMAWPCNGETFADLEAPRRAYAEVAHTISRFEPVTVVVDPRELGAAQSACGDGVSALPLEIDDSWTRDTGPTYLVDGRGEVGGVDWKFNGYGKFEPHDRDAAMSGWMLERSGARRFEAPIFLEGGAIHGDGRGTLLTTESVVLNPNRNPGLTRDAADAIFRSFLGVSQVIWLDAALEVDTTDGHVDNLACFTQPGVVAVLAESDTSDPHYEPLRENRRRLELSKDAEGRPFEIVEIQQPARREYRGERLPFSYINYYIANGGIVLPVFGDPADERAIETVRKLHPDRQVVPVPALEIVKGGGGIHCITQQEPNPRSPS